MTLVDAIVSVRREHTAGGWTHLKGLEVVPRHELDRHRFGTAIDGDRGGAGYLQKTLSNATAFR